MAAKGNGTDTREAILAVVEQHKAIHKSELCRRVDKSWGTVGYHIEFLKTAGVIRTSRHDGLLWVYPSRLTRHERKRARLLAAEKARMIRTAVEERPGITVNELSDRLSMPTGVIRRHLSRLTDANVLEHEGLRPQRFRVSRPRRPES